MPTVADLGRMVKQKYPGAYDDMPDDSLGLSVQQKFPGAYDDFTAAPAAAPSAPMRKTNLVPFTVPPNPLTPGGSVPMMGGFLGLGPEHLLATLPAAGATAGGIAGIPLGPWGIAGGGAIGAGLGRTGENMGREALGLKQNPSLMEQFGVGANLPPRVRQMIDVGEQAAFGGILEGVPAKLFGIPGRATGSVQAGLGKVVQKAEGKVADKALRKERERFAAGRMTDAERSAVEAERAAMGVERTRSRLRARDIGSEIEAASEATTKARQQAGAAKKAAVRGSSEEGVEVSLEELTQDIMARQQELFGRSANPARLERQVRREIASVLDQYTAGAIRLPRGASRIVDARGKRIPPPPLRLPVEVADNAKKALGERLAAEFAGIEKGATPKGGLRNMVQRVLKERLESVVPDLGPLNKAAGSAIRESKQVESLAARQPGPTVSRLRETQATRAAEASARQGARARPAEEAVRQAMREREAVATALNNFREQPFWDPHLYLSGGLRMTTPRIDLMAHGLERALQRPGVATGVRRTPDAINFLLRAMMANGTPMDEAQFSSGNLPDSLRTKP